MIKFFRNIRQRLLSQNRFSRYLIYALGEIILVVIGILIALQINNWNENKKGRRQEAQYLQDLKRDLQTDITTLNERISGNDLRLQSIDSIFHFLGSKSIYSEKEVLDFIAFNLELTSESYFIPEKSTIHQIESSSAGNLITNKKLRDLIFRYYSNSERLEKNMEVSLQLYQHNFITERIAAPVFINKQVISSQFGTSLNLPDLDISKFRKDVDYLTAVVAKQQGTMGQNWEYQKLRTAAQKIIDFIEKEVP